jgi:hypothetical protein
MSDQDVKYGRRKTDLPSDAVVPAQPVRFAYLYANAFEAAVAIAAIVAALQYWVIPTAQAGAVYEKMGAWAPAWAALYGVGGLLVLFGLAVHGHWVTVRGWHLAGDGRMELAGLYFVGTALLVNAIALLDAGLGSSPSLTTYAALWLACALRIRLIRTQRKAEIPVPVPAQHGREN